MRSAELRTKEADGCKIKLILLVIYSFLQIDSSQSSIKCAKIKIFTGTYTTLSILDEDNCFLIVSLDVVIAMIIMKCYDKHLHNKKCVHCGLKTTHFQ